MLDAVRRCWASLWNERAIVYRARQRIDPAGVAIAVVVQELVDAEASGVMFTADPITGDDSRIEINAVLGLGEALVSGQASADSFTVERRTGRVITGDQPEDDHDHADGHRHRRSPGAGVETARARAQ